MAYSLSFRPGVLLALSPSLDRTGPLNPLLNRTQFSGFSNHRPFLRGSLSVTKFGFKPEFLPDPDASEGVFRELFTKAESFLYTIADAAVSSSDTVTTTATSSTQQNKDWLSGIADSMETVLKVLKDGLSAVHTPYAYGFAIILLTVLVKAATFPLTRKQVESTMAMRSLQPQIKAIQERYAGDQERIQLETARIYKVAGINPLAGCLPTLATIPVWIGLYRALSNVANEGLLTEGFFWIPSLAGPTTIVGQQKGSGISWLFPFVDGHPPLGWPDTFAYLVLPVLLVVSQYISVQIMQSSQPQSNDPNTQNSQVLTKFLPLMIGYFSLSVPSGLSLYWLTNNLLSTAQQVWLQKLGGAKNPAKQLNDDIIKGKQLRLEKSLPELNATRKEVKQEEKLTPDGKRPGERFKQLKEQEARRKQQREEQGKAEEAVAKADQITNEGHEIEGSIIDKENGAGTALNIENNEKHQYVAGQGSSNIGHVNGDLKEDQKKASSFSKSSESLKHIEKETVEAYTSTAAADNKDPEQDTQDDRKE